MAFWSFIGHLFAALATSDGIKQLLIGPSRPFSGPQPHLLGMANERTIGGLETMLSADELAEYLGVAPQAIYGLRTTGRGPRAVHVGRELRYRVSEIESWIDRMSEASHRSEEAHHGG